MKYLADFVVLPSSILTSLSFHNSPSLHSTLKSSTAKHTVSKRHLESKQTWISRLKLDLRGWKMAATLSMSLPLQLPTHRMPDTGGLPDELYFGLVGRRREKKKLKN